MARTISLFVHWFELIAGVIVHKTTNVTNLKRDDKGNPVFLTINYGNVVDNKGNLIVSNAVLHYFPEMMMLYCIVVGEILPEVLSMLDRVIWEENGYLRNTEENRKRVEPLGRKFSYSTLDVMRCKGLTVLEYQIPLKPSETMEKISGESISLKKELGIAVPEVVSDDPFAIS